MTGLPLEFLIPYEPKDLYKDVVNVFDVKSHQTLMDHIRMKGMGYLDSFCHAKMKKQKNREKKALAHAAKASNIQFKRVQSSNLDVATIFGAAEEKIEK